MTLNGVMTADARYLCGSWASCSVSARTDRHTYTHIHTHTHTYTHTHSDAWNWSQLINTRSTSHWWHWEGHWVRGEGQPAMAVEMLWTWYLLNHWMGLNQTYNRPTSHSRTTNWLSFHGDVLKGQGHRNVLRLRHRSTVRRRLPSSF